MSMDRHLKRAFPFVVLGALGLVAYFQARGIGHLLGSSMTETSASPPGSAAPVATATGRDGAPILDRNPFGPEASSSVEPAASAQPPEDEPEKEARDGSACDFGRVVLITSSDDERWSFASIAGKDGKVKMRRLGDDVDGYAVDEITSTRVWLKKDGRRCFLQMGSSAAAEAAGDEKVADATDWAKQIRRLNDGEVVIERAAAEAIAASPATLMGAARMRPERQGDRTVGLRLSRVRRGSLLDALGLQTGDRLESINGQALDDPSKVMALYERMAKLDRWSVSLVRHGATRTIAYRIR